MKTLQEILQASTEFLHKKGIKNARRQAEDMLCDLFSLDRLKLYMNFERPLTVEELAACRERLSRRAKGEPLAYIHGEVEFYHCKLKITPEVLIPRQETEILVDKIVQALSHEDLKNKRLWDICCGSGCIGIALKKRFPELQITLSDISPEALKVARENAEKNGVEVRFLQGDLLTPFKNEKADFIVCNPPYVSAKEYPNLDKEVLDFEPRLALVGGEQGTEFYERLAKELPAHLNPHAKVWFEIGYQQGDEILRLFGHQGKLEKDWSNQDRFFFLENE